jgi:divalent metal cation (Fe/Co/Zn/Cd) transporter
VAAKRILSRKIDALGRDNDSRALEGDAWHHLSDAITCAAAAIGISIALIGGPGWEAADDYAALFACAIIVLNVSLIVK